MKRTRVSEIVSLLLERSGSSQITEYDYVPFEEYVDSDLTEVDSWPEWSHSDTKEQHAKRVARWVQIFRVAAITQEIIQHTSLRSSNAFRLLNDTVIELDYVDEDIRVTDGNHRLCALIYVWRRWGHDASVKVVKRFDE